MEDPRPESLETVAARVVAWHNRHPLARRIHAEQVQSVGYVALPYWAPAGPQADAGVPQPAASEAAAPAGGTLRERAAARAKPGGADAAAPTQADKPGKPGKPGKPAKRGRGLKAAFTEDFIAPLSPQRVARWAARHAVPLDQAPRGAPLRQVEPAAAFAAKARELQTLYVQTAMVESRGKRVRMLLSPSSDTAVLGGRLWSPPRVAGGAAGALGGLAAVGLALALWLQPAAVPPAGPAAPAAAASGAANHAQAPAPVERPASAAALPSIKPASMRAAAQAEADTAHTAALPGSAAAQAQVATKPPAEPPVDVEPQLGRINLPPLGLPHGDEARAAARERRLAQQAPATAATPQPAAMGGPGAPLTAAAPTLAPTPPAPASPAPAAPVAVATAAPAPTAPAAPSKPPAQPQSQAMAASATGQAFALSSRRLRTRAETEQTVAAVRALLTGAGHSGVQVEMMPAGDDWRIVSWPFGQRAQAEQARTLLASRGIRLEVVAF